MSISCVEETCTATIKNYYWNKVKSGWFIQKDGTAYCPVHIPDWVSKWRKR